MHKIQEKLTQVHNCIQEAAKNCGRNPKEISLVAVSKRQASTKIRAAYDCGQRHFGESYCQEALTKIQQLKDLNDIIWHFIGPIQSNKTLPIAENFHWVHSVDRLKVAERLHRQRPERLGPLNSCLQINIDSEEHKAGISAKDAEPLAVSISKLNRLNLRGIMAIPQKGSDMHRAFSSMENLFRALKEKKDLHHLDTLSMGMSGDMEQAIAHGTTMVRIGTGVFGERKN